MPRGVDREAILDDLGVTAPGQFVAFVKAVPLGELDALASLQSICPCTIPNWELPFGSFWKAMWPGTGLHAAEAGNDVALAPSFWRLN